VKEVDNLISRHNTVLSDKERGMFSEIRLKHNLLEIMWEEGLNVLWINIIEDPELYEIVREDLDFIRTMTYKGRLIMWYGWEPFLIYLKSILYVLRHERMDRKENELTSNWVCQGSEANLTRIRHESEKQGNLHNHWKNLSNAKNPYFISSTSSRRFKN
jgi:hypothetical protein